MNLKINKFNNKIFYILITVVVVSIGSLILAKSFLPPVASPMSRLSSPKIEARPSIYPTSLPNSTPLINSNPSGLLASNLSGSLIFLKQKYSKETLVYFTEVAFGSEYGGSEPVLRKWEKEQVHIDPEGEILPQDSACLNTVITDFNLLSNSAKLIINENNGDITMHFAPESKFKELEPNYVPVNYGFFWKWWDTQNNIKSAQILISSTGITDRERCHLIREELTQSMGLGNDSKKYPESIFSADWTSTTKYTDLDSQLIQILYNEGLTAGIKREKFVIEAL